MDLDALEREAGLDPDGPDNRLRRALATADDDLLERLVQLRKDKGLTQQVVADRMRRDKAAVSNFERLGNDPHLSTIRRYAAAIGACITHEVRDASALTVAEYSTPPVSIPLLGGLVPRTRTHPRTLNVAWSSSIVNVLDGAVLTSQRPGVYATADPILTPASAYG